MAQVHNLDEKEETFSKLSMGFVNFGDLIIILLWNALI